MELYVSNIPLLIYEGTLGELETYNYKTIDSDKAKTSRENSENFYQLMLKLKCNELPILTESCNALYIYVCMAHRDIVLKLHVSISNRKKFELSPLVKLWPWMKFCKCRISKSIKARNLKHSSADRG